MPMLEKSILAKMPLPHEVQILIKKYLQAPTPTARLMKQVSIEKTSCMTITFIGGIGVRMYELRGRWSAPPLRPEIQYWHTYRNVYPNYWQSRSWDTSTGEQIGGRGVRRVRLTWPVLLGPENLPTCDYWTREEADEMARRVRSWTPVSI